MFYWYGSLQADYVQRLEGLFRPWGPADQLDVNQTSFKLFDMDKKWYCKNKYD